MSDVLTLLRMIQQAQAGGETVERIIASPAFADRIKAGGLVSIPVSVVSDLKGIPFLMVTKRVPGKDV